MREVLPEVSVIVCHHVGELLFGFLDSIFKSTNISFEVIVVTSNEQLAEDGIKNCNVIYSEEMPAQKRNVGACFAKGKYLAFFDDDVEVEPDCLWELRQAIGPSIGMSFGKLWNMEHRDRFDEAGGYLTSTGFIWSRAGQHDLDTGQYNHDEYIFAGKSASCMIRREIFERLHGFDKDFGILGEESDVAWRVWLSGKKVLWAPRATGYHAFNTKFKPKEKYYTSSRVHYNGSRNYVTMLIKNLERKNLWRIVPIHILIWLSAAFLMILTLRVRQGFNILKGQWYVLRNLKLILKKRKEIQSQRKVTDADIWPHVFRSTSISYYANRFRRYIQTGLHG